MSYHDLCFSVQLLCKTPTRRLKTLERFKRQTFFYGTTFDLALLQRQPVEVTDGCLDVVSFCWSNTSQIVEEIVQYATKVKWFSSSSLSRWFWSWERDQTEPPKLDEASLCLCSPSRASTTTPSSALPPRRTHSWMPAHRLTWLCRSPARHTHFSLLRKKVHVEKCLCDGLWVYSTGTNTLKVKAYIYVCSAHLFTLTHRCGAPSTMSYLEKAKIADYDFIGSIV